MSDVDDIGEAGVRKSHPPPDEEGLARLAGRQHGVVAQWQLSELGLSPRAAQLRAQIGRLHRLYPGVYAVGHRNLGYRGRWMAAVLAYGPNAVLSHRAALSLWDLIPWPDGLIDVTIAARGRRAKPGTRPHCVRTLDPADTTRRTWIPVTTLPRTLLDHAEQASAQRLRLTLEEAIRREVLDGRALEATLQRNPGRHGTPRLRQALNAITGPLPWTQSELERRFLTLIREAGLPEPQTNQIIAGELVDAYWPQARLVVELDGYHYHKTRKQFEADRRRDTTLTLHGLTVIRLTQPRLENEPARVTEDLRTLIGRAAA